LGGPLSKLCVTHPFSINFQCQIENQVSDYRLLGASSLLIYKTRPNDFDLQLGCCISDAFSIFFNNKKEEKHKAL
jgi:hypothetical protein